MSDLIGPQSLDSSQRSEDVFSSPDQLAGELATLTLLPRSRWQTLLKLEVIQVGKRVHHPMTVTQKLLSDRLSVATEQTKGASETVGEGAVLLAHASWC